MYKLFKLPFLLGTIITFVLGYFLFDVLKLTKTFSNFLLMWLVAIGALFFLNLLSILKYKAHQSGEKLGSRLAARWVEKKAVSGQQEPTPEPTFFQEACELSFIGEFIPTFFALIPLVLTVAVFNNSTDHRSLKIWETILIAILTFFWLKYLESVGKVRITTPLLPIPLIWLIFPIAIWMIINQMTLK